ncbi:hypothetical protein ACH4JZ_18470 [Streptomyces sp. NPDC017615]|uniref:hypothetical protein n=1 Tax=Streptomyces sp. NPDC017615 TaxID=3365003 RepID=UPI003794E493
MSTPKRARTWTRKGRTVDTTKNVNSYRVEASWNTRPNDPVVFKTSERKKAYSKAREFATMGAYVILQGHLGWDRWRTLDEFDGPAEAAAHRATERAAVEDARKRARAAEELLATAEQRDLEQVRLERLMTRPPVPRDATGRVTARHTAGA